MQNTWPPDLMSILFSLIGMFVSCVCVIPQSRVLRVLYDLMKDAYLMLGGIKCGTMTV